MAPAKNFVVRVFVYSFALLYLSADLFLFKGPLYKRIQAGRRDSPETIAHAKYQGVVARVFGRSIFQSQIERVAIERLWLQGKTMDELQPDQRKIIRLAALNDLIDHQLLRMKVKHNTAELPVSDAEVDAALQRLEARYPNKEEMQADLTAEGIDSEKELRLRLGATIQQQKYLESRIAEGIAVTDEEAREWFAEHQKEFITPPRVQARHIFLSTLNRESSAAKTSLEQARQDLLAQGKSFAQLAASLSEDERTKRSGGELGWISEPRLPADLGKPLMTMPIGKPQLLRSKIGWHLVEVTEKMGAESRSFDDARDEVIAALEASKREIMVPRFRQALRAQEDISIHVFSDMITGE